MQITAVVIITNFRFKCKIYEKTPLSPKNTKGLATDTERDIFEQADAGVAVRKESL